MNCSDVGSKLKGGGWGGGGGARLIKNLDKRKKKRKNKERGLLLCLTFQKKKTRQGTKGVCIEQNKETFQEGSKPGRTQEVLLDR